MNIYNVEVANLVLVTA